MTKKKEFDRERKINNEILNSWEEGDLLVYSISLDICIEFKKERLDLSCEEIGVVLITIYPQDIINSIPSDFIGSSGKPVHIQHFTKYEGVTINGLPITINQGLKTTN